MCVHLYTPIVLYCKIQIIWPLRHMLLKCTTQYSFIFLFKYAALKIDDSRQIPYNGNDHFNILYLFLKETD